MRPEAPEDREEGNAMSGSEIRRLVHEFLAMIDEGPSPSDLDLVDRLDRLACAVHSIPS